MNQPTPWRHSSAGSTTCSSGSAITANRICSGSCAGSSACNFCRPGSANCSTSSKPTDYFTQLGIPFPEENAWLVASPKPSAALLLALGLLSRLTCVPLVINFIVAYITTEQKGLHELLGFDTGDFTADAAFPFLATAVVILIFGPGALSLDYLICLWRKKEWRGAKGCSLPPQRAVK